MDSLSSSLEVCGSTKTLVEDKELNLAQLEEIKMHFLVNRKLKPLLKDVQSTTSMGKLARFNWIEQDQTRRPHKKACGRDALEDQEYIKEIKELHAYLDMEKTMVRPGCSPEVLKITLNSMSALLNTLTFVSSVTRPHASL